MRDQGHISKEVMYSSKGEANSVVWWQCFQQSEAEASVYHFKNPKALKNIATGSLPVLWKNNPKAWVAQIVFQNWFFHQSIPEEEKYCLEKDVPFNILFATQQCSGLPPIHGLLSSQCQNSASVIENSSNLWTREL